MKKRRICGVIVLLLILAVCTFYLTDILMTKWKYPCYESVIPTDFYDLEDNSVEVCVLGSSQVVYGISGMELYGDYGISAYSLGTALQPMAGSYAWLRESRKTQDIRLVVLDVSMLYEASDEARYRQAFDNMKLSRNKLELLSEYCRTNSSADPLLSYMFPIIKYHSRWSELEEDDFTIRSKDNPIFRGNFAYALYTSVNLNKVAYDNDTYDESLTMREEQLEYFEKIISYCEEEGLELLLIKTPKASWSLTKHIQMEEYAQEHGLDFIDFSSLEMIETLGLDTAFDFRDKDHLNIRGAYKLSVWLGQYLKDHYDLTDFRTVDGYDTMGYERYCERLEDSELQLSVDVTEYFSLLNNERYETVLEFTGNSNNFYTEELAAALQAAGLSVELSEMGGQRYVAWLRNGESVYEAASGENFSYSGKFANGIKFTLTSNFNTAKTCKMTINYETETFSERGLNVLVYDVKNQTVVDKSTIYYDAAGDCLTMYKNNEIYKEK